MKNILLPSVVLLLLGCAGTTRPPPAILEIVLPSGEAGYSISCGNASSLNRCYELAGQVCMYGYDVMNQQAQNGFVSAGTLNGAATTNNAVVQSSQFSSSTWQQGLLVKCHNQLQVDSVLHEQIKIRIKADTIEANATAQRHTALTILGVLGGLLLLIIIASD